MGTTASWENSQTPTSSSHPLQFVHKFAIPFNRRARALLGYTLLICTCWAFFIRFVSSKTAQSFTDFSASPADFVSFNYSGDQVVLDSQARAHALPKQDFLQDYQNGHKQETFDRLGADSDVVVSDELAWVLESEDLPACERLLLFEFKPWWGFASEYILYMRAAALAKKLDYDFIEDDSKWNYGRLRNYFKPRVLNCKPPADWANPSAYIPLGSDDWQLASRVHYSRAELAPIDDWTREIYLDPQVMAELKLINEEFARNRSRDILAEGDSLPAGLRAAFDDQTEMTQSLWNLNDVVEMQVAQLGFRLGMAKENLLVPRGGEILAPVVEKPWYKKFLAKSGDRGDEAELNYVTGTSRDSKRGPMIGIHLRLGDKAAEFEHDAEQVGITNTFGNPSPYLKAATHAYRRLLPSALPPLSAASPIAFSPAARPNLIIMTAEPGILNHLQKIPLAAQFEIQQTPAPKIESLRGFETQTSELVQRLSLKAKHYSRPKAYQHHKNFEGTLNGQSSDTPKDKKKKKKKKKPLRERKELTKRQNLAETSETSGTNSLLLRGYTQSDFNSLPLKDRVIHTQAFVRDLSLLSKYADAFIVSGASNVGRLSMLIAGADATVGPLDEEGKSLGGRIRSVDSFWYPTAYSHSIFSSVEDIEDNDNKPTIPNPGELRL